MSEFQRKVKLRLRIADRGLRKEEQVNQESRKIGKGWFDVRGLMFDVSQTSEVSYQRSETVPIRGPAALGRWHAANRGMPFYPPIRIDAACAF